MNKHYLIISALLLSLSFSLKAQVVINEFSAANLNTSFDNYFENEDWIELYNTSPTSIDLSGYHLSDRMSNPDKWTFPSGVTIPGNGHLLIWASKRDEFTNGSLHTNFKVTQTKANEDIIFAAPNGDIIDSHTIDIPNQNGHSRARLTDGANEWGVSTSPSPGNNNNNVKPEYITKPIISPLAGFYTDAVEVSIENASPNVTIYYTTNGNRPDNSSTVYTSPFTINSTSVVKAVAYANDSDAPHSFIDYHTYFINENHSIPVVSISGEALPTLLSGTQIDPQGYFELFDENGERVADASGEFNKHGNDSWFYSQRGVDFITRDQLGDDYAVKHKIFPQFTERKKFQRIILKAGANDNYPAEDGSAYIRDAYVHQLSQLADLEMDERTYEPCALYLNGQYWGLYEMREKVDDHDFTDYYYNQDKEDIDFIKTWGWTWEEYGSDNDWYELTDFINSNDMADPDNYIYASDRLNVLSLIDYIILHSHNVSSDWLNWNTGWWRGRNPEGEAQKWRYILWDEDATFGHYINYTNIPDQSATADPCNPEEISPFTDFEGHVGIFSKLAENPDFFSLYINRYADLNNTFFSCDYMIPLLDDMIARITPEMSLQIERWGGSMSEWLENVEDLRMFIETRCTIIDEGILDCYEDEGLTGPFQITINVEPAGTGKVKANTIIGQNYPWETTYFGGVNFELTAVPEVNNQFVFWEVNNNTYAPDQFSEAISMSLESDDEITAHFSGVAPCIAPINFEVTPSMFGADLTWLSNGEILSYEVRYRPLGSTEDWEVFTIQENQTTLNNLEACTDYEVELRTICSFSLSAYSQYSFITECANATDNIEGISEVRVYPNPSSEAVNINFTLAESSNITLELTDFSGRKIFSKNFQNLAIGENNIVLNEAVSALASGMYIVHIQTNRGRLLRRIMRE